MSDLNNNLYVIVFSDAAQADMEDISAYTEITFGPLQKIAYQKKFKNKFDSLLKMPTQT